MTVKVQSGQTMYDIAIQLYGTVDNAFALAQANGKQLGQTIEAGEVLNVPEGLTNDLVLRYFQRNNLVPASKQKPLSDVGLVKTSVLMAEALKRFDGGKALAKTLSKQTFYDVSLQYFGTTDHAYEIAVLNQKSVTDRLIVGTPLRLPDVPKDKTTLQYFRNRNITPATGIYIKTTTSEATFGFPDGFPFSF
jgi:LysM repeat protein